MTLRERLRTVNDRRVSKLHIPQWGCDVHLRELSAAQRDIFELHWLSRQDRNGEQSRAMIAAMALVEEDGTPVYQELGEGILDLMNKNGEALSLISAHVMRDNKFWETGAEEVAKNSAGDQPAS